VALERIVQVNYSNSMHVQETVRLRIEYRDLLGQLWVTDVALKARWSQPQGNALDDLVAADQEQSVQKVEAHVIMPDAIEVPPW
jgi:hypothetical protein